MNTVDSLGFYDRSHNMDYVLRQHKQRRFSTEGGNYRKHYWFQTWVFRKMQYTSFSNLTQTDFWRSIQLNTCTLFVTYYTLWTKRHNCKDSTTRLTPAPKGPDAMGKFLCILRKNLSPVRWDKCARWCLDLPNFVEAYQTSKTPSSCLRAGQFFVGREIWQIC